MCLWKRGGCCIGLAEERGLSEVGGDAVILFLMPARAMGAAYNGSGGGGYEKGIWNK